MYVCTYIRRFLPMRREKGEGCGDMLVDGWMSVWACLSFLCYVFKKGGEDGEEEEEEEEEEEDRFRIRTGRYSDALGIHTTTRGFW